MPHDSLLKRRGKALDDVGASVPLRPCRSGEAAEAGTSAGMPLLARAADVRLEPSCLRCNAIICDKFWSSKLGVRTDLLLHVVGQRNFVRGFGLGCQGP